VRSPGHNASTKHRARNCNLPPRRSCKSTPKQGTCFRHWTSFRTEASFAPRNTPHRQQDSMRVIPRGNTVTNTRRSRSTDSAKIGPRPAITQPSNPPRLHLHGRPTFRSWEAQRERRDACACELSLDIASLLAYCNNTVPEHNRPRLTRPDISKKRSYRVLLLTAVGPGVLTATIQNPTCIFQLRLCRFRTGLRLQVPSQIPRCMYACQDCTAAVGTSDRIFCAAQ
jgi:hypothetical protein